MSKLHLVENSEPSSWELAVSSWVDGESEARYDELDTPYGRQLWDNYHLIGDVLRSSDLAINSSEKFYARLSKAIDDEPTVLAPHYSRRASPLKWGISGLAVAAAVATVAWVALPYLGQQEITSTAPVVASAAEDNTWLDYVDAHRAMSGIGPARQVSYDLGMVRQ